MKAKVKKRINSRKKHANVGKHNSQSVKKKPVSIKGKPVGVGNQKLVKNSISTVKGKKRGAKFVKGVSGNPKGRPKGSKNKWSLGEFQKEFDRDMQKHKGSSIYEYFFKRARKNDVVLIALLKKWQPDLKAIEQINVDASLLDDTAYKNLCAEYSKRFED